MTATDAVLTVDLHHGHLDPEVATLPVPAEKAESVVTHAATLTAAAREHNVPVIHVTSAYRTPEEIVSCPKWRPKDLESENLRDASGIGDHNPAGSKLTEIMPEIRDDEEDVFVHLKKRYSPFLHTDLEFILDNTMSSASSSLASTRTGPRIGRLARQGTDGLRRMTGVTFRTRRPLIVGLTQGGDR